MTDWKRYEKGRWSGELIIVSGIVWLTWAACLVKSSATILSCSNVTMPTEACCLCPNPMNCESNVTCPDGFQLSNDTLHICKVQETSSNETSTVTSTPDYTVTGSLCYKCKSNEYFNGMQCVDCDGLCFKCHGQGSDNCDPCLYKYKGSCVTTCPNNTVITQIAEYPDAVRCITNDPSGASDEEFPTAIVAGSAVGGLVLIVVVVVVIVVVCRRKKPVQTRANTKTRTAMSEIIEERSTDKKPEARAEAAVPSRRRNYENQPDPGAMFGRDIQNHGDQILRYVKDPTGVDQKAKPELPMYDDSDNYANASMIRVHTTFKDKSVSQEKLQEHLDAEEILQLPMAPLPPGKRPKKHKEIPEEPDGDEYIDMNQGSPIKPKESNTARYNRDTKKAEIRKTKERMADPDETDDDDKEDYENTNTLKKQNRKKVDGEVESAAKSDRDRKKTDIRKTKARMADPDETDDDDDKEDYENTSTLKRQNQKKVDGEVESAAKSNRDRKKTDIRKTKARMAEADEPNQEKSKNVEDETNDDESDEEDYENMSTLKRQNRKNKVGEESYENLQFGTKSNENSGTSETEVGDSGEVMTGTDEDVGVDIAEEDYENSGAYKMNLVNDDTSETAFSYENVEYLRK